MKNGFTRLLGCGLQLVVQGPAAEVAAACLPINMLLQGRGGIGVLLTVFAFVEPGRRLNPFSYRQAGILRILQLQLPVKSSRAACWSGTFA